LIKRKCEGKSTASAFASGLVLRSFRNYRKFGTTISEILAPVIAIAKRVVVTDQSKKVWMNIVPLL
jgi:hypothetical protein